MHAMIAGKGHEHRSNRGHEKLTGGACREMTADRMQAALPAKKDARRAPRSLLTLV
jgi:hypothetical protein